MSSGAIDGDPQAPNVPPPPSAPPRTLSELPDIGPHDPWNDSEPGTEQEQDFFHDARDFADVPSVFGEGPEPDTGRLSPMFGDNFVAAIKPLSVLRDEYAENPNTAFVRQIEWLEKQGYVGFRRTRPDGDCFYRSLGFAYVSSLLRVPPASRDIVVAQALSQLDFLKGFATEHGSDPETLDEFVSQFTELVGRVASSPGLTHRELVAAFNDMYLSNSTVVAFRTFTSTQIKSDAPRYQDFLFDVETDDMSPDPAAWCAKFVDPLGKDADHTMIQALVAALNVRLRIAYVDGHPPSSSTDDGPLVSFVDLGEDPAASAGGEDESMPPVELLYRPGHYDVLEKRAEEYDD